MSVLY